MRIWIDKETGTWGNGTNLVLLSREDTERFLEISEFMSDSEISAYAEDYGYRPFTS